jgi:hypothetical protein
VAESPEALHLEVEDRNDMMARVEVYGDTVYFVTPDGRTAFTVRARKDGRSLDVSAVQAIRVDGKLYDSRLQVGPRASNAVVISTMEYDS